MLPRRVAAVTFAAATLLVIACGHQVTPNPAYSNLSGDIVLRFRVNGTLDFTNYTYAIIIDTCGNGTPYPQAYATTYNSYSYGFFIGGASYGAALPQLIQYFVNSNSSGSILNNKIPASSSLENFNPNDNGQGNEFELIFSRSQLNNPSEVPQPCPNIPASTVSPTPTTAPGSTPTVPATSAATLAPGASPTPNPFPTIAAQEFWAFNFFTIQGTTILDSLGIGGPTDVNYSSAIVDTNSTNDVPIFKAVGGAEPSNPAAQLSGGDIQNYL